LLRHLHRGQAAASAASWRASTSIAGGFIGGFIAGVGEEEMQCWRAVTGRPILTYS
jgi:hypothetical protein